MRSAAYAAKGVAQVWLPFLRSDTLSRGEWVIDEDERHLTVRKYAPRDFERWIHGFCSKGGMSMYDPQRKKVWRAKLLEHELWVPYTEWIDENGEDQSRGGYSTRSKRYRDLQLDGPIALEHLDIVISNRTKFSAGPFNWPAAKIGHLRARPSTDFV